MQARQAPFKTSANLASHALSGGLFVREATPQEARGWDEIVARFDNYRVFHKTGWLRSIEAVSGAKLLLLVCEKQGDTVALLPGFIVNKAFLKIFGSPLIGWQTESMGPVFDRERISTGEMLAAFTAFLEKQCGVHHIELSAVSLERESMEALGFRGELLFTYRIELFPEQEENVLKRMHSRTRTYVRRTIKDGLVAKVESSEAFVDEFYDQTKEVFSRRGKIVPFTRNRVLQLFRHLKESGNLLAISVRRPEDCACMATGIFTIDGRELCLWGWAHLTAYNRYHPTELLAWTAMQKGMEAGCVTFDLAGGGDAKVKFGAVPDTTTYRWMRSRYKWLADLRVAAESVYRRQQSLRGRLNRKLNGGQKGAGETQDQRKANGSAAHPDVMPKHDS